MTHHRRGPRPSRNNTPESYRARKQRRGLDGYEGRHLATPYETPIEATTYCFTDSPPPESQDTPWVGNTLGFPHAEDGVPSVHTLPDQTMAPGDGILDHIHFHQLDNMPREPTWEQPFYQPSPRDQIQASMSPIISSPSHWVSAIPVELDFSQTEPDPSSGYQYYLSGAASAFQDWMAEADTSQHRRSRRWSMRARQGSGDELPYIRYDENDVAPLSTDQPVAIENINSGDSSGDNTPVDRDQYVRRCMSGEDGPWSPERVRRA